MTPAQSGNGSSWPTSKQFTPAPTFHETANCGRPVIALANYHGVDSSKAVFSFRSMAVETLGEAWRLGWKLTARCAFGNRDGMKSIRECIYRAPLDMQTLVWTRGPNFPLSRLESRLMCPECGSRRVTVLFDVPKVPVAARAKRATER